MLERSLNIRDFHSGDLEKLHEIDRICFPADLAYSRAALMFCINHPRGITRIAEAFGKVAGFVLARIVNNHQAHILTLDVLPEVQKHGIGTELMKNVHQILESRKIRASILEVGTENLGARCLYEKLGYGYVEHITGYYNAGTVRNGSEKCGQGRENIQHGKRPRCDGIGDAFRMVLLFNQDLGI